MASSILKKVHLPRRSPQWVWDSVKLRLGAKPNKPQCAVGTFSFWPPPPVEPRIQFLGTFDSSEDISPIKTSALESVVFCAMRPSLPDVQKPYGVAIRDGKIYVCDIRSKALVILDFAKKQTRIVGVTVRIASNAPSRSRSPTTAWSTSPMASSRPCMSLDATNASRCPCLSPASSPRASRSTAIASTSPTSSVKA